MSQEHLEKTAEIARILNNSEDGVMLKPQHFMGEGVYVRTLFVPAGYAFVGKLHKTNHVFAIISGQVAITDEEGVSRIYEAPYFMESKKGSQRSIMALEDSILMNAHACDTSVELEKIEDQLVEDHTIKQIQ